MEKQSSLNISDVLNLTDLVCFIKEDITVPKNVNIEILESIMVTNNKNKETYFYIGDVISATNGHENKTMAFYMKDGQFYVREKDEFVCKFTISK